MKLIHKHYLFLFAVVILGATFQTNKTCLAQTALSNSSSVSLNKDESNISNYEIISSKNNKVNISFTFDQPELVNKNGQSEIKSETQSFQAGGRIYPVPFFSYPVLGKITSAKIVSRNNQGTIKEINLQANKSAYGDTPMGLTEKNESSVSSSSINLSSSTTKKINWNYVGSMRGKDISYLHIYPYTYSSDNKSLSYDLNLQVEITFADNISSEFDLGLKGNTLLTDKPNNTSLSKSYSSLNLSNQLSSSSTESTTDINAYSSTHKFGSLPVIPKYKMIVEEDGIYQIGFFEFQDAEFPDEFFQADPRTFRVFNKGIEIPILVAGESDGKFDRNDYIEFIGEFNKVGLTDPDRPDMYNDPFTNKNVYYFYWESTYTTSNAGLRMVEVPAQIRRTISSQSSFNLKGRSFRSSLHFEEDNITSERMSGFFSPFNQEEYSKTRNHSDARDLKFWSSVSYGRSKTFDIVIPSPDYSVSVDEESLKVQAAFHGQSIVNLNGKPQNTAILAIGKTASPFIVTETSWGTDVSSDRNLSRQDVNVVEVKLPITQQRLFDESGEAVIQITNRDDINIGTSSRSFYFNWLNITYRRLYEAFDDELEFTAPPSSRPGLYQFQINGFTTPSVDIYKIGVGKLSNFSIEKYTQINDDNSEQVLYRVIFQDDVVNPEDISYIALASDKKKLPSEYIEVEPANVFDAEISLRNTTNNYNYIIISSDQFINQNNYTDETNAVKLYKEYREVTLSNYGEPNNILVTTVEGIYDEFNNGIKSPYAIRDFLSFAYHNWTTAPTYILLLGDASRNNDDNDLVPTMHVQTIRFGATGSDVWYTMVDGIDETGLLDLLPEMQISRVPAKTLSEINAYLNKLMKYELYITDPSNASLGEWQNKILLVCGETGAESIGSTGVRKDIFITQADNLIQNYISKNFFINRLHTNLGRTAASDITYEDIYRGSRTNMFQFLNNGCLILNFMGHGGGAIWSDSQVMTLDGVDDLNNFDNLPFVTSMTCFTGAFDEPQYSSGTLSEKMILTEEKGAVGFIGSAGLGWLINDDIMARSIFQFLLDDENKSLSIGDLLFRAKTTYYLNNINFWDQVPSMIYQYGIFGDPALRLAYPSTKSSSGDNEIEFEVSSHILNIGDTLTFTADLQNLTSGIGFWQLTDSYNFDTELDPENILFIQNGKMLQFRDDALSDTIKVPIVEPLLVANNNPSNFQGGQVKFYIRGSGVNKGKALHSHLKFTANGPFIVDFGPTQPIQNSVQQPLTFYANVDDKSTITSVDLRVTVEELNESLEYVAISGWNNKLISAYESSPGEYITSEAIPASIMKKSNKITYDFIAQNTNFNVVYSETKEEIVGELPDLAAYPKTKTGMLQFFENSTIDFYTDTNSVKIGAEVYNWSSQPISDAKVYFYENSIRNGDPRKSSYQNLNIPVLTGNNIIGVSTISVGANQSVLAKIDVPSEFNLSQTYSIGIKIVSDTSQASFEESYSNNLSNAEDIVFDLLWVDNTKSQEVQIDENITLSYTSNSFSKSGFLQIETVENPNIISQPDNQFIRLKKQRNIDSTLIDENYYAFKITALDSALYLKKTAKLSVEFDSIDDLFLEDSSRKAKVGGYHYASNLERWIKLGNQTLIDSSSFEMNISKFGTFSVMYSSDETDPVANLGIEGQYYSSGGFAPKKARIVATLQDQNGINLDPQFITIIKDGDSSESIQNKLTIPESTLNANSVGISFDDEFEPGSHEISFIFHDSNLNQTQSETMQFVVETEYGLKAYGNFPNPFTDETDIAYEIVGEVSANTLEFKIYTVAGKLINTFNQQTGKVLGFTQSLTSATDSDARTVGLHIYRWDGTDSDGHSVANGVYFCKIKASFKGNIQEEIIKIARIR